MNNLYQQEAFTHLIQNNRGIILKICHSYFIQKNDREDLEQEIVYQLWKSYPKYNARYKFSTWMYRVALNVAISFYRNQKKSGEIISLTEHNYEVKDEDNPASKEEDLQLLQQFIHGLPELARALMILYLDDKSYKEIAEILGISETNVATKISRIKERLKQKFATVKN